MRREPHSTVTARTAEVLGGECKPKYDDPFGAVTAGSLRVCGKTLLGVHEASGGHPLIRIGDQAYYFRPDTYGTVADGTAIICLSIAKSPASVKRRTPEGNFAVLKELSEGHTVLVLSRSDHDITAYERLGWCWADSHEHWIDQDCKFCNALDETESQILKIV